MTFQTKCEEAGNPEINRPRQKGSKESHCCSSQRTRQGRYEKTVCRQLPSTPQGPCSLPSTPRPSPQHSQPRQGGEFLRKQESTPPVQSNSEQLLFLHPTKEGGIRRCSPTRVSTVQAQDINEASILKYISTNHQVPINKLPSRNRKYQTR